MKTSIHINEIQSIVGSTKLIEIVKNKTKVVISTYGAGLYDFSYDGTSLIERPKHFDDYLTSTMYYGKTVGRTSGRLFPPDFEIDGIKYPIVANKGIKWHHHGGNTGFSFKEFEFVEYQQINQAISITLRYISSHLENGFPGNLTLDVIYELDKQGMLKVRYKAISDADTLCNITNHTYFNLNQNKNNLSHHYLKVYANKYLDIDENYYPVDKKNVLDTPFDLREYQKLDNKIEEMRENGELGYDHAWILSKEDNKSIIQMFDDQSKIGLDIYSSYPSVVMYTHNHADNHGLQNVHTDGIYGSIAIEPQFEPSGIYHKDLNHSILKKGQVYDHYIQFKPYKRDYKEMKY